MKKQQITKSIKDLSSSLGFTLFGVSNPVSYNQQSSNLDMWIHEGKHASMDWINNRSEERENIFSYFPEVKSVISLGYNYYSESNIENDNYKISNYSWGEDYHIVLKKKLNILLEHIISINKEVKYRLCVDTSPIMEKLWAQRSGLGWIGKHTNLISPKKGSWFFLSEILLDIELIYNNEFDEDLCGTCTRCLDECPTDALDEYILDSNKCISYLTIEHRGEIDKKYEDKLSNWIYGCDICQDVCPWNIKFQKPTNDHNFHIRKEIELMNKDNWNNLSENEYKKIFKKSAIKRTKYSGITRNIQLNKDRKIKTEE